MLQDFGIPKDAAAFFALKALMAEGLSLGADTIKAVRAIVLRHTEPRRAALLAARAIAAGLQADDEGIDVLIRSLSGVTVDDAGREPGRVSGKQPGSDSASDSDSDPEGETGGETGQDDSDPSSPESDGHGSGQHNHPRQGGQQHSGGTGVVKSECHDEEELRKALESAFMDLSARAAADPGFAALARKGPDGRGWLCVPYQFSIDGVDFSGFIRIVFNYATSRTERLVAEIDTSGLTRVIDVSWGPSGKPQLRFMPGTASEGVDFTQTFGASMMVELIPQGEDPVMIDAAYREVDGHA